MPATNKAAFFKTNPGGTSVINTPVAPGANGTWSNYVSATDATQTSAQVAAGYLAFDYDNAGTVSQGRIPFYSA